MREQYFSNLESAMGVWYNPTTWFGKSEAEKQAEQTAEQNKTVVFGLILISVFALGLMLGSKGKSNG